MFGSVVGGGGGGGGLIRKKTGELGTKDEWFTSFFTVLPTYSPKKLRNKRINLGVSFL